MKRRIKTSTPEERAYKNALLIGGNFSELDTEINFRKAERKKNNFHGSKINNHCNTKPKKRRGRQVARKDTAENTVITLGSALASHERNKILRKEGKKKPRRYY